MIGRLNTLADYRALVRGKICRSCGTVLMPEVNYYDHPDGWLVEGFEKKQWLYTECRGCGYQNALWKLDIVRPFGKLVRR